MKVIHLGTQGTSLLGVLDDDGNVVERRQVQFQVDRLASAEFVDIINEVNTAKETWQKEIIPKEE